MYDIMQARFLVLLHLQSLTHLTTYTAVQKVTSSFQFLQTLLLSTWLLFIQWELLIIIIIKFPTPGSDVIWVASRHCCLFSAISSVMFNFLMSHSRYSLTYLLAFYLLPPAPKYGVLCIPTFYMTKPSQPRFPFFKSMFKLQSKENSIVQIVNVLFSKKIVFLFMLWYTSKLTMWFLFICRHYNQQDRAVIVVSRWHEEKNSSIIRKSSTCLMHTCVCLRFARNSTQFLECSRQRH